MKRLFIFLGLMTAVRGFAADPIMPAERQAIWQGNVGIPGGIPIYPVCVNVRNAPFNAVGDGVHDDSQAIQAAIAACTNGGAVYLPAGIYLVSTNIVVPPGYPTKTPSIALRGDGPGLTTIELGAHDNEDVILFRHGSQYGTPTSIIGGLSQNNSSIVVSNAAGFQVGSILSISELNDTNFVSTNEYNTYGNNAVPYSAQYPATALKSGLYAGFANYNVTVTAGTQYQVVLGGDEVACVNGAQTLSGPDTSTLITAQATNLTLYGNTSSINSAQIMPYLPANNCGYCGENGQRVLQQYVAVTSVNGTNIGINPPLLWSYSPALQPQAKSCVFLTNCGVEDMTVQRLYPSTNSYGSAHCIEFDGCARCWLTNVETCWPQGAHVKLDYAFQCQIESCFFHDGWSQCSGQDYGVWIFEHNSNHLIENCIFMNCRHSMVFEAGGAACVFGYNFSTNVIAGEDTTSFLSGDELLHGAHPWFNLYEGNESACIRLDYAHGSASHNTYYREHIYLQSYASSNSLQMELNNWSTTESPQVQTTNGYPGGWIVGPGVQGGGAFGADIEAWSYSNNIVGCVFTTNSPGPFIFGVTNLNTFLPCGWGCFEHCGYLSPGNCYYAMDPVAQTSTYWHGNWDPVTKGTVWNQANADHALPRSLYLTNAPGWWVANMAWPPFGPDLTPMINTLPARVRLLQFLSPPPKSPTNLHVISGG